MSSIYNNILLERNCRYSLEIWMPIFLLSFQYIFQFAHATSTKIEFLSCLVITSKLTHLCAGVSFKLQVPLSASKIACACLVFQSVLAILIGTFLQAVD